jgi:phosphate-selective porin OprO/OprP
MALAQALPQDLTSPAQALPAPIPSTPKRPAATSESVEDRLKRMEEAYERMQQSNAQIQSKYEALLSKFEDLTNQLSQHRATAPLPTTTTATGGSSSTEVAGTPSGFRGTDGAVDSGMRMSLGALEDENLTLQNFLAPYFQQPSGAQGRVRRGNPSGDVDFNQMPLAPGFEGTGGRVDPNQRPEASDLDGFRSRMDLNGIGAQGTGGRVSPDQQPAAGAAGRIRRELQQIEGGDQAPNKRRAKVEFGEGLEFASEDEEYRIQIHNLTQAEFRGFPTRDQGVLQSQFFVPRERWYFTGDLTKHVGFYTVVNRSYGTFDILDAFISLRVDDRLRLRVGRMKTPYLYEYFSIAEGDLIAPERSLFGANLSLNRQIGAMFLGELFDSRLSYAVGAYNGPRNSFGDFNSAKDVIGTINWRPFLESDQFAALKYFNIGGSWDVGYESNNNTPQPTYFETANDQANGANAIGVSPTFLHLNNNVVEQGERVQWGAHMAWYYKSLFLMGEYGGARAGYGLVNGTTSTPINFSGYHVTASYFLTGEQLTRRVNVVKPRSDFNFDFLKGGPFSPGAWEVFARYCTFDIANNIFSSGFADPNLWTNHAWTTDIGLNWYLTFYTRIYLDWQHAEFGNPVAVAPGRFSSTTDLFWLRFQIFF